MARSLKAGARFARVLVIALALALSLLGLRAQDKAPPSVETAVEDPLEALIPKDGFEIPPDQLARLGKFLPNSLGKLEQRQPMHIVALGDSVTRYVSYDEHERDTHHSYVGVFASELAKLFFYTGTVRELDPFKGQPEKVVLSEGPEITIENMGLGGRVSLHALARTSTDAFVNKPSLLTISYGINDSYRPINLATYLRSYAESAKLAKAAGCDVAFFGPTTMLDQGASLAEISRTQQYSSALETLAAKLGVFYFDLGSITASAPGVVPAMDDAAALTAYNAYRAKTYHTHQAETVDLLHPSEETQRLLGRAVYDALLTEPVKRYRVGGSVTLDGGGGFELSFKLKNLSDQPIAGRIFPMPFAGFVPERTSVPFDLKAGKGDPLSLRFKSATGSAAYKLDGAEPLLRVPLLVADADRIEPLTISGALHPFSPIWALGATDELNSSVGGEFTVIAGDPNGVTAGEYSVEWAGERSAGRFSAGSATGFSFPLPTDGSDRRRGPLILDLKADGKSFKFTRGLEVSRNFGLGIEVPMLRSDRYDIPKGGSSDSNRAVTMSATVNLGGITIVHKIGMPMRNLGGKAPYYAEIQIDARSYGKRRQFGFNDFIRITPLGDGTFKVNTLRPGIFGNGYGKTLDRTAIKVTNQPLSGGGEQLTVTIPRSYFYLHEWALGNANSLVGINTKLFVQSSTADVNNLYPRDGSYSLVWPQMSRFNSESLTVLELTERPTRRWSSRLW